jgi:hypothetical protein
MSVLQKTVIFILGLFQQGKKFRISSNIRVPLRGMRPGLRYFFKPRRLSGTGISPVDLQAVSDLTEIGRLFKTGELFYLVSVNISVKHQVTRKGLPL